MTVVRTALESVRQRIACACTECGRNPRDVTLVAVSKTVSVEHIRDAFAAGQRHFGENYVQEALAKIEVLAEERSRIEWHLIGPLQSNKAKLAAAAFDWIESVDRLKIAQILSQARPPSLPPLNVCIQVNIDDEESKSGVSLAELPALAKAVHALPHLAVRGLMAIPAPGNTDAFTTLVAAFRELRQTIPGLDTLSMGMSADFEAAIREGATSVRVGTAIFGSRA